MSATSRARPHRVFPSSKEEQRERRTPRVAAPFTSDRQLVDEALRKLASQNGSGFADDRRLVQTRIRSEVQYAETSADYPMHEAYNHAVNWARVFAREQVGLTERLAAGIADLMRGVSYSSLYS